MSDNIDSGCERISQRGQKNMQSEIIMQNIEVCRFKKMKILCQGAKKIIALPEKYADREYAGRM